MTHHKTSEKKVTIVYSSGPFQSESHAPSAARSFQSYETEFSLRSNLEREITDQPMETPVDIHFQGSPPCLETVHLPFLRTTPFVVQIRPFAAISRGKNWGNTVPPEARLGKRTRITKNASLPCLPRPLPHLTYIYMFLEVHKRGKSTVQTQIYLGKPAFHHFISTTPPDRNCLFVSSADHHRQALAKTRPKMTDVRHLSCAQFIFCTKVASRRRD